MDDSTKIGQYKKEYCKNLIDHMSQGKSFSTFGSTIGFVRSTMYLWAEKFPEFGDAKDQGEQLAQEWFEEKLLLKTTDSTVGKNIDTSCLIFALKTRFHKTYGERQKLEYTTKEDKPMIVKLAYNTKE